LREERTSTTVLQLTCHILDQFMRKLHIPPYVEVAYESTDIWDSVHIHSLHTTNFMLWDILNSNVDCFLFRLLGSSPQETEEECLICFYACTSLVQIYKIRAMKYSRAVRERNVDAALSVTQKNIRKNTGFLATALLEEIMKLRACCEEGSTPSFLRQVLCRWRSCKG